MVRAWEGITLNGPRVAALGIATCRLLSKPTCAIITKGVQETLPESSGPASENSHIPELSPTRVRFASEQS